MNDLNTTDKRLTVGESSAKLSTKWTEQAEAALTAMDTKALKNVIAEMDRHNKNLSAAVDAITCAYAGKLETTKPNDSDSVIIAMRDVALAAIDLAKASLEKSRDRP